MHNRDQEALDAIANRVRGHRIWLERCGEFERDRRREIAQDLKVDSLHSLQLIAQSLSSLGLYYGTRAVVERVDRVRAHAVNFSNAVECYRMAVGLQVRTYYSWFEPERIHLRTFFLGAIPLAVNVLCHDIAIGAASLEKLYECLLQPYHDEDVVVRDWWSSREFESAMMHLFVNRRKADKSAEPAFGKVYAAVLSGWTDDEAMSRALRRVCQYHLHRMDNTRGRDAEFRYAPFDLTPIEILAIQKLRGKQTAVDHPLCEQFGSVARAEPAAEVSELLSSIRLKCNEFSLYW